ncbi:MAG: hypothetical protein CMM93_08635 [Rickettsiales bacterium]|nr:hypothetical protein [Rickettsiales bacterium]
MDLKILHSEFEISLQDSSFSTIEENNWFTDQFVAKYTYPFSITLTPELQEAFSFIQDVNATGVVTIWDIVFYVFEKEHDAVLEIKSCLGDTMKLEVRYGFEEFPNYGKKLAQLPLYKEVLSGETIRERAEDLIGLTFPATDYNFPAVHTEKFDTETDQWAFFEEIINNYNGTSFLENTYDAQNDIQENRNIMQPMPSLLYVLQKGFEDAGYTLEGDILEDTDLKPLFIHAISDFYSSITDGGKEEIQILSDEYDSTEFVNGRLFGHYSYTHTFTEAGRYKVSGNLFVRAVPFPPKPGYAGFLLDGEQWAAYGTFMEEEFFLLDGVIEVLPGQENMVLHFSSFQRATTQVGGTTVTDATILDITIVQLTKYNANGDVVPTLLNPTEIDLTQCVPDITFGDLHTFCKRLKNFDTVIGDGVVTMNYVLEQLKSQEVFDLQDFETAVPERIFNQGKTIELKYQDTGNDDYPAEKVLVDINGVTTPPYVVPEGSKEISLDAVVLPLATRGGVTTALDFTGESTKLQLIRYSGLINGLNLCRSASGLSIQSIYQTQYQEWIQLLLSNVEFNWSFYCSLLDVYSLKLQNRVFAYGRYHTIKKLTREKISNETINVTLETIEL